MAVSEFEARIDSGGVGSFVAVPADVVAALGGGGRIPVTATFAGIEYQGSVVTMGGKKVIGITKAILEGTGRQIGDTITVTLARDDTERTVEVPKDLRRALREAGVEATFDELAYTHRREYVRWIDEAKKPETRVRRIAGTIDRLQV